MDYPDWICIPCGQKYGKNTETGLATFHTGKCDICKREGVPVTEPRDFGNLKDGRQREVKRWD